MASQELKHRTIHEDKPSDTIDTTATMNTSTSTSTSKTRKRTTMAKRGLRSLAIAIALPLSLTILDIVFFGSSRRLRTLEKTFYFPPLWALHSASLGSALLMGLSAWLVWAEGGFHQNPGSLLVYLGQVVLSLAWVPVVFGAGASRIGLVLCVGIFGALVGCLKMFGNVNPIAGDLVKPCMLSALLFAITNLRLVYH